MWAGVLIRGPVIGLALVMVGYLAMAVIRQIWRVWLAPDWLFFILTYLLVYVVGLAVGFSATARPRGGAGLADMIP